MRKAIFATTFGLVALGAVTFASAQEIQVFPSGSSPSVAADPKMFSGQVVVDPLVPASVSTPAATGLVAFAPGARTAWHTHPAGQTLIVTAGKGWVQLEGQPRQEIKSGDTVWIPAGVRHWHGASAANSMSHIAITFNRDGKNVDWMELVTDQQYAPR